MNGKGEYGGTIERKEAQLVVTYSTSTYNGFFVLPAFDLVLKLLAPTSMLMLSTLSKFLRGRVKQRYKRCEHCNSWRNINTSNNLITYRLCIPRLSRPNSAEAAWLKRRKIAVANDFIMLLAYRDGRWYWGRWISCVSCHVARNMRGVNCSNITRMICMRV